MVTILIDSREQQPYNFSDKVSVACATLTAGDYSLEGYETQVAVERKSLEDFVQTIIKDRERFRAELKKLREFDQACIVVEADISDIINHHYLSGVHANALFGATISIIIDYGIPIYFLGNRQIACRFVEEFLLRYQKKQDQQCQEKSEQPQSEKRKPRSKSLPEELIP